MLTAVAANICARTVVNPTSMVRMVADLWRLEVMNTIFSWQCGSEGRIWSPIKDLYKGALAGGRFTKFSPSSDC